MRRMNPSQIVRAWLQRLADSSRAWWAVLLIGAEIVWLAVVPSSHRTPEQRRAVLRQIHGATAPLLSWFLVLSALISLVIIRIVVATAVSYGLSQYALEVLVRTLVLELIPLYATLFVAVRYAMPQAQVVRRQLAEAHRQGQILQGRAFVRERLMPRALGAMFSVLLLAALSCVVALVLTYLTVYGFSPWGLPGYTRSVGGVFTPAVTLIFSLKTLLMSLAVAIVPMAGCAQRDAQGGFARRSDIGEFARLFSVVLLIEVASLVGNYY